MSETLAFLKIRFVKNGTPTGESRVERFFEQIEISDFSFGVSSKPEAERDQEKEQEREKERLAKEGKDPKDIKAAVSPSKISAAPQSRVAMIAAQMQARIDAGKSLNPARTSKRKGSGNRTLAAAKMTEVSFSKRFDASSAFLLNALNGEDTIDSAVFTVVQRDPKRGGHLQDVLVVTVRRAVIEAIDLKVASGSGSGLEITEEVTLRSDREGFGLRMQYISPTTNAASVADYGSS